MVEDIEHILERAGIRPTSNRILVLRSLLRSTGPLCLADLESELQTVEKSSVSRVLALLLEKGVVHAIEDGRGIIRYEPCHGDHSHEVMSDNDDAGDLHAHFYCEVCRKVYCLSAVPTPRVSVPEGFEARSINYMIKGICPSCRPKTP